MKSVLTELDTKYSGAADPALGHIPSELIAAIQDVYKPAGMQLTDLPLREAESAEYGASRFGLDGHTVVFRVAKTTPTKIGQFVTIWKRPSSGSTIAPLDVDDGVAFVVVSVSDATHRGQFVFDHTILAAKGIMAINGKGGKRAIRVYPPWVKPVAKEAVRTQQWQLRYFLSLEQSASADSVQVRRLFEV
ncbi:MepB family protein [Pseudomonas kulmbachensis]|uniref:MepB family protein n=1 Tax=Pseudomonas kulmbachensis TaxID=3043408 RepID=UPI002AAFA634|nr:MepB family protein [Pseudomonas sp. V3/3/4/13]